jgi:hypothetical protein
MRHKAPHSGRKISETFLNFALPLLKGLGAKASKDKIEEVLKIAFTVWNSVVFDRVDGNTRYVARLRKLTAADPASRALVQQMIARKQTLFADDHRLIGEYSVRLKNDEWRLWAEARDPGTKR